MKRIIIGIVLIFLFMLSAGKAAWAGEMDVLLSKLVEKGILTPAESQIIADDTKLQVSRDLAQAKSLSVPEWTQRIKWGGDVRYRTQGDWAKKTQSDVPDGSFIKNQQIRNRIRGRFFMEGKVNDFTYAGTRLAGGALKANSTNDTLTNYWDKNYVMFDQYYMRFEAPSEIIRNYGQYFSDLRLWAGRFPIPFEYSEMVWDSDINPAGIAINYASPDIKLGMGLPSMNVYSNGGMLWLTENSYTNTDPILWALQLGVKTDEFGPMATTLNFGTAIYNFANMQDKKYTGGQYANTTTTGGTNTRWWMGDELSSGDPRLGSWRYGFDVLDLLLTIDNKTIAGFELPNGLYLDFINNFGASNDLNQGYLIGGYIGKKKIKEPGDWKAKAEYRFIGRDAIPDFMPDSDFYGFGTFTSNSVALNANNNGLPMEGGTNGKGVNMAFEYQLLKNTALNIEYYWMKPIKSWDKTQPWNELQFDVVTKF